MDYESIKTAVLLGNTIVVIIVAVVSWIDRKAGAPVKLIKELGEKTEKTLEIIRKDFEKRCDVIDMRYDQKCVRISKIESDIRDLPSRTELARLHERIDTLIDDFNKNSRENNLLLGEIAGQVKQIAKNNAND